MKGPKIMPNKKKHTREISCKCEKKKFGSGISVDLEKFISPSYVKTRTPDFGVFSLESKKKGAIPKKIQGRQYTFLSTCGENLGNL